MIDSTVFIASGTHVMGNVRIGRDASVWYQAVIRGDTERIEIGSDTNIQDFTMVHADPGFPCLVGDRVTVGHRVILHGCVVESDCLIGMGAILLNGAVIGAGSVVGAGSLIREGQVIPANSLVVGSPGRVLREVTDELRERIQHSWRHYVENAQRHREGRFPLHAANPPSLGAENSESRSA